MVAREGVLEEVAFELRLDDRAPAMGRGQQPERPVQVPRGGKKPGLEFSTEAPGWSEPDWGRPPWCQEKGRGRHRTVLGLAASFGLLWHLWNQNKQSKKKKNTQQQLNHTTVRMHEGKDEVPFPNFSHFLSYSTKLCELKG